MKINNFIKNIFTYTPPYNYQFSIPNTSSTESTTFTQNSNIQAQNELKETKNIFTSLNVNLEYIKTKYNILINSDIITREFTLNARGKQYKSLLLYIDGMVDSELLNNFVLTPLMLRNRNNIFDSEQNRVIS